MATVVDTRKVHVWDGANKVAPNLSITDAKWTKSALALAAGSHAIKVNGEDKAGNLSGFRTYNIITGSTVKPTVDLLDDTGESSTDNYTNDNTPRIKASVALPTPTGASAASATSVDKLALFFKDAELAVTNAAHNTADATFQLTEALPDGDHIFTAKWLDKFGTWSALGTSLTITVDTASPTAPTIDNLVDGQVIIGTSVNVSGGVS
ncbi:hypothetical protein [uncultured Mediterranean phage]|nr:hypothetical protein [uncultured Mediterranean phage]